MNGNVKINAESQLQVAVGMLLEKAADKSAAVAETINNSIRKIAAVHSNQVLVSCCEFCRIKNKTSKDVTPVLLIMETITRDNLMQLDGDTILFIIEFSLEVMTQNPGYDPLVQTPASGVLVALGRKHYVQVMEALLKKLEVGVIPHYMIPHTLGALASANAFGVIPYLKGILSTMLPLLNGLKADVLKQAFSYAIGCFCDALIEYTSNLEQAPDPTITISNFYSEVGVAYDVLFTVWLHSREPKVVESVLQSLSAVFPVLDSDKITSQTPRIIPVLLNLYKKQPEPYHITKCLDSVIQIASRVNGMLLEPLLSAVLQVLVDLVSVSPDYAQPSLLRNHSEALRCYECLAVHFTDHTIDHLISQLKNNNEKERIRALLVVTHLTNATENAIKKRSLDIIKVMTEMLNETSIGVKKVLLKAIVAFACKGMLLNTEINPTGPEKFMEFILKLCCKQVVSKSSEMDAQDFWDMQRLADNTLFMLTTSVQELEDTLWGLLLRCFLNPSYDEACVIILKCLTHLSSKKDSLYCDENAFVRCLVLLAQPLPSFRGTYVLNFLRNIRPSKKDEYKPVWDMKIPQLLKYLEQSYDDFNDNEWQDLIFDFFTFLLDALQDDVFNEALITTFRKQLYLYNNNKNLSGVGDIPTKQNEKRFLLKCLAIATCYLKNTKLILETLDIIVESVKLNDMMELQACSEAIGICSKSHLQLVLDKISLIRKDVLVKKSKKFFQFNFIKDQKHDMEVERVRFVVICSYAEVCIKAAPDQLLKTIQNSILDFLMEELSSCKDFVIRKACIHAIGCVADAMHPNRNTLHIRMQDRDKVLQAIMSQMQLHNGTEFIELFPVILPVLTSLIRLPLPLESNERMKLIKLCFENIFNASAIYCKINQESNDSYYGDFKQVPHITSSFSKLNQLVQELLMQNISPATLDEIVMLLEPWMKRKKSEQRLPSIEVLRNILQTYLDNMKFAYDTPSTFGQTGFLLARIVPRCTDSNKNIRKVAVECLCLVLCIASRYEGRMRDHDKVLSNSLQHIQQQIDTEEPKLLFNLTNDLAHVISVNMPQFQLSHFVDSLIDSLVDVEMGSCIGSGVVLNIVMRNKGGELQTHVVEVLEKLLNRLSQIHCPRTRSSALRTVLSLACHQPKIVTSNILSQPIPYDQSVCDCWHILSTDLALVVDILEQIKKIIKHSPLYEEQGSEEFVRIASLQPLQATCALDEIFKNSQMQEICQQQFPELFTILFVALASYIGTSAPAVLKPTSEKKEKYTFMLNREAYKLNPAKIALNTFKQYLLCCGYTKMATSALLCTHLDAGDDLMSFQEMTSELVKDIYSEVSNSLSWMVACLGPYIRSELDPQRIAVVAFLANLLKQKINDQTVLAENLLEMLLDVQNDQNCIVRMLALQGLGFGAEFLNIELISRHCNPILSALMQGLDYRNIPNESSVVLEAMLSFSKLLQAMEGQRLSSCQVTAAVRIKPLLSQEDKSLREAAIHLLGNLAMSLNADSNCEAFKEQVQGNFITLLLHLCDSEISVIKTCKYSLRKIAPYLNSPKVNSMIQEHLIEEAILHFTDFITDLIKLMAEELQDLFPLLVMTTLSYLKSPWVEIRSNAALVAGLLYFSLSSENKPKVSLDTICDRLLRLLNDDNEDVRAKAGQAIAYLFIN